MGSLKLSGSADPLKLRLFQDGFASAVMSLIAETWQEFSLQPEVHKENNITALFHIALCEAEYESGRNWIVNLEDQIIDPTWGDELGRNDIRFYPPKHAARTIFFSLECKRLRVTTASGFKPLANEYVKKGIQRFVDSK